MRTALLTALLLAPLTVAAQTTEPAVRISLNENGDFESGDNARVRVRTERDGYLVVLRTDVDGWIRVLYPTDPFHDNFVRGGREFEVRGRGDREAFQASWRGGSGIVLAAYSPQPFEFTGLTRNDHWDYRALDTLKSRSDPEAALLAIVDQMADSANVEYDVLTYTVSGNSRSTTYTSSYYYYPSWYYPHYSSFYYDWYRPYYRWYNSCYFCVSFSFGYRPWWGYRSHYFGYYRSYGNYARYWRPYYSSYAYGFSYRSWNRFAFNDWNGGTTSDRGLRNARTGEVAVRSRYTEDLADRRRREVSVAQPGAQTAVVRRVLSVPGASRDGETATVARRVMTESGRSDRSGTSVAGRRENGMGDRAVTIRRDVTSGGRVGVGESRGTIRRVEVPERRAVEPRTFGGSGRTFSGGRTADGGERRGVSGGSVGRDRPGLGGGETRRSPDSYSGGGRVSPGGGRSVSRDRPSSDGGRQSPSGGGGRVSPSGGGEGRRSPGGYSAPSRGSIGGGGDRSAPSSGGGGRRRPG